MSLRLGDIAPDFKTETTEGVVSFHEWLGNSWGILFSHPADYTPVCTTELGTAAKLKGEFDKRNVKMIAISVDALDSHQGWIKDINETQGCTMNFPIIADPEKKLIGEGNQYRYILVKNKSDFPKAYIKRLLKEAFSNSLAKVKDKKQMMEGLTITKSISAKKRELKSLTAKKKK